MNQSELIEKVAQVSELNQAAAGRAVKAVVNAILDTLVAGDGEPSGQCAALPRDVTATSVRGRESRAG
jgi:hypothetical protein